MQYREPYRTAMKIQNFLISILLFLIYSFNICVRADIPRSDMVDMFMGVKGISNCVIGPQLPHGSINPSPQTPNGGHNGYDEHDLIRGFGQLHVSGIGWARYGQIFLSPQTGFSASEDGHDSPKSEEIATPYFYKVHLDRYGIDTEVAPSHHAAAYRFSYPEDNNKRTLLVDLRHSIPQHIVPVVRGTSHGGDLTWDPKTQTLEGWGEYAGGFGSGKPYKVFFSMRLDDPDCKVSIVNNGNKELYARIDLTRRIVNAGIGVSLSSVERATTYRNQEVDGKNVDDLAISAKAEWEKALGRIEVQGSEKDKRLFYTTLYHSLLMPRDRSGDRPDGVSDAPHIDDHFCVWDTWRTVYPLMALIEESFVAKTVNSFIDRMETHGKCTPTFTSSMEWDVKQGGDDVDNIIADAIVKNVKGFDRKKAYGVMLANATGARDPEYIANGWIAGKGKQMSCSYTMEYAYNDDCLARTAAIMGDTATADTMRDRSRAWETFFDPEIESDGFRGFIAPRDIDGSRIKIDPAHVYGSWVEYFYEGNSWTYTLFTPAQIERLIELFGGKETTVNRLRHGFDKKYVDIANEPGFLAPFIFSHCDRPDLTADYVNTIRSNSFSIENGYPDNEDSGAMGSWFVFTSIGLFPNAGQDFYYLLPPAFDRVDLTMENGKKICVSAQRTSHNARYIASVKLNGAPFNRSWISHDDLSQGAHLEFELTDDPTVWHPTEWTTSQ